MVVMKLGARQDAGFLARNLGLPSRLPRTPAPVSRAAPRVTMASPSAAVAVMPHSIMYLALIVASLSTGRSECGFWHRFRANAGVSLRALGVETKALRRAESMRGSSYGEAAVCVTDSTLVPGSAVTYTTAASGGGTGGGCGGDLAMGIADGGGRGGEDAGDGRAVTKVGGGWGNAVTMLFRARPLALHKSTPTHVVTMYCIVTRIAMSTPPYHASPSQFAAPFSFSCSS